MSAVRLLSDEQLLARLADFGCSAGPITATTRNIYEAKLKRLLSEAQKSNRVDLRRSPRLSNLSSTDEGSDSETGYLHPGNRSYSKKKKAVSSHCSPNQPRNVSSRGTRTGVSAHKCISTPTSDSSVRQSIRHSVRNIFQNKHTRTPDVFKDDFECSDSDTVDPQADYTGGNEISLRLSSNVRSNFDSRSERAPYFSLELEDRTTTTQRAKLPVNFLSILRHIFKLFGDQFSALRRLQHTLPARHNENNGFIPRTSATAAGFLTSDERNWFSRHYQAVSKILVVFLLMFFIGLAISYATISRSNPLEMSGNYYPVCADSILPQNSNCIPRKEIQPAVQLVKSIYNVLRERSWDTKCTSLYGERRINDSLLTDYDLVKYMKMKDPKYKSAEIFNDIRNLKILILSNPHWRIVVKNKQYEDLSIYSTRGEIAKSTGIICKELQVPSMCYVWYLCNISMKIVLYSIFWLSLFLLVCKLLAMYIQYVQNHKERVNDMVKRIVAFVSSEYCAHLAIGSTDRFVIPIDYVREQLMPHEAERKRSVVIWTSAVNFINRTDSRLREDVALVNGENKTVWLWIPEPRISGLSSGDRRSGTPQCRSEQHEQIPDGEQGCQVDSSAAVAAGRQSSRIWQGQAFETMAGSPNSAPCSPTPCLKIRHMFNLELEHGDNWHISIQDAILEKCEEVSVLHLYVDKTSREGCVYMKCLTPEDAGKAYCSLHGWWFGNSQLVTVKYLRVERYHERFPEAVNAKTILCPSNDERRSLRY